MRKLNLIIQEITKFTLLFLLSFVWIRYFVRSLLSAFLISLLVSAVLYFILLLFNRKKQSIDGLKLKEKAEAEDMFLSLACDNNAIDFFVKLASKKHDNIIKHKNYLVINHKEKNVKTLLYVDLVFETLGTARFMEIYNKIKKEKASKIVICSYQVDKQLLVFCKSFQKKFLLFDQYETYQQLYKFYNCFPEITHKYSTKSKLTFKDFMAYSFNKKRTKGYLFSAFVLILSGLFVRTTIYYCIIASLLVVFALISQFNHYFNIKSTGEIL